MWSTQIPQVFTWRPETRPCLCPKDSSRFGKPEEKAPNTQPVSSCPGELGWHCVILTWCSPRFCRARLYGPRVTANLVSLARDYPHKHLRDEPRELVFLSHVTMQRAPCAFFSWEKVCPGKAA